MMMTKVQEFSALWNSRENRGNDILNKNEETHA